MIRSGFKRPVYERPPVVVTPLARRGVYARVGEERPRLPAVLRPESENLPTIPATRDKATKAHLDRLHEHGCIACVLLYGEPTTPQIHHPREFAGGGEKADDWLAIPLCREHHQGDGGVHGDRSVLRQLGFTSEAPLLAITLRRIYG